MEEIVSMPYPAHSKGQKSLQRGGGIWGGGRRAEPPPSEKLKKNGARKTRCSLRNLEGSPSGRLCLSARPLWSLDTLFMNLRSRNLPPTCPLNAAQHSASSRPKSLSFLPAPRSGSYPSTCPLCSPAQRKLPTHLPSLCSPAQRRLPTQFPSLSPPPAVDRGWLRAAKRSTRPLLRCGARTIGGRTFSK